MIGYATMLRNFALPRFRASHKCTTILERAKINHLAHHFFTTKQTFLHWLVRRDIQVG